MSNDDLKAYIESVKWRTAKDGTHQYTIANWAPEKEKEFRELVATIYDKGYKEEFMGQEYTYLEIGGYIYWSMNYSVKETILINRKLNV